MLGRSDIAAGIVSGVVRKEANSHRNASPSDFRMTQRPEKAVCERCYVSIAVSKFATHGRSSVPLLLQQSSVEKPDVAIASS